MNGFASLPRVWIKWALPFFTVLSGSSVAGPQSAPEEEAPTSRTPFVISVDDGAIGKGANSAQNQVVTQPATPVDRQSRPDTSLGGVDVQIRSDGFDIKPQLSAAVMPPRDFYRPGEDIYFSTTSNYPDFIQRSEIRISTPDNGKVKSKLFAVIPAQINRTVRWTVPEVGVRDDFIYVLRVYDKQGRYDETKARPLFRSDTVEKQISYEATVPGAVGDLTAVRNIPVHGGAVTVHVRNAPPGSTIEVFDEPAPLAGDQPLTVQRILPPGEHDVNVSVSDMQKVRGLHVNRQVTIPDNDWFYVALADFTVGKRMGDYEIEAVRPGEYDEIYYKGRVAFYLKGKIKGEYLLTAAADTGEDDVENLFSNQGGKNPKQLLRRLDPDDYYPVYGDDSDFSEDAPTRGKFYVRLERGDDHVMWGNYKASITGTELLRTQRSLYGANAVYKSEDSTSFGEPRSEVAIYGAQPDTLPQREEFLATGGSSYFLKYQDIVVGSETLTVEFRNPVTDRVVRRTVLRYGEDYNLDYLQGLIILKRPLSSSAITDEPVRDGVFGGEDIYLVVQYEFEPAANDLDSYIYGGRAQHWLNDNVRIGLTGVNEGTGAGAVGTGYDADQQAIGADIVLRYSEATFLEAEVARSEGARYRLSRSTDGGLTFGDDEIAYSLGRPALAWRVRGQADLKDVLGSGRKGTVGGYYEEKRAGFSTLHDQVSASTRSWGLDADVSLGAGMELKLAYDDFSDGKGEIRRNGTSSVGWQLDKHWKTSVGVSYTELNSPGAAMADKRGYNGSRLDFGVRADYQESDDKLLYAFGQATLDRSGDIYRNDRVGVGAELQLTEGIRLAGELSYGTHGLGALAGIDYTRNDTAHYYLRYRLDPARAFARDRGYDLVGSDRGVVVAGMRRRVNDRISNYAENSYDMFGERRSLTRSYGFAYTPDDMWTIDAGIEAGRVHDRTIDPDTGKQRSDFERYAPSLAVSYRDEEAGINADARGEVRIEDSEDGTRDQNTYLFTGKLSWQSHEDWRLLANIDAVVSDSRSAVKSFNDTDYVEASLGYAYRPVEHERLNGLFKYTWLYDKPGDSRQDSGLTGQGYAPAQRTHIMSADFNYDLNPRWTIGAKYGYRYGKVKYRSDNDNGFEPEWQRSTAHLGIVRADFNIVKSWDALLEGRVLYMPEADTADFGALAVIYRHVGNNLKLGLGYNFGKFSDDLRDLTLNDRGIFLNIVGKF